MKKRNRIPFLMLLTVFFLSACGSKDQAITQEALSDYGTAVPAEVKNESVNAKSQDGLAKGGAEAPAEDMEKSQVLPAGRKLIRNISMNVETDEFDTLISSLEARITQLGGYTEQSDMSGNSLNSYGKSGPRHASLTVRIPADQTDSFLTTVETCGNVTNKSESVQDITLQYSDLESRKKSLEIEQKKLWEFLEKAESIDTVISLEQRLSEVRYQLESMESQLRLYDNQVDYSTVCLTVNEVTTFTPTSPESAVTRIQKGFIKNSKILKNAAGSLIIGTITTSPFWFPIVLASGILIFFHRKRRKKTSPELPAVTKENDSGRPETKTK